MPSPCPAGETLRAGFSIDVACKVEHDFVLQNERHRVAHFANLHPHVIVPQIPQGLKDGVGLGQVIFYLEV